MSTATLQPAGHDHMLGHPKGLFVCFLTEMWERFAFYGMKALLFLYLTQHHLFDDKSGYLLLGTYAGLAYALPLVGGMLADAFDRKRSLMILTVQQAVFSLILAVVAAPAASFHPAKAQTRTGDRSSGGCASHESASIDRD